MIVGIGVDSIEISRINAAVQRRPGLLKRLYTPAELEQLPGGAKGPSRLAAVFAAKEAALKALGTGLKGHSWQQVEVLHQPDGRPKLYLRGRARATARDLGVARTHLSLTHDRFRAMAFCILEGGSN